MKMKKYKNARRYFLWITLLLTVWSFLTLSSIETFCSAAEAGKTDSEPNETPKEIPRPDHSHPAFGQRTREREALVSRYIAAEGIRNQQVIDAMKTVPRHSFVPKRDTMVAYADRPLYIGYGQTISQPYIVAYMTEALQLDPNDVVLEVGTGSAYQAAVCAEIAKSVYTIEIIDQLAQSAKKRLEELGYHNVFVKSGDGYYGWPEHGPFDAVIVTCAAGLVPPPLIQQLKPGGKMIIPLSSPFGLQNLVLLTKDEQEKVTSRQVLPVRFVPMTGRAKQ